ncbi:hypothetical protein FGO68_gene17497 [Halteria grandinella]|uniref:Uncharacterized protein n=1 Tax=Halteria grandinella TaxID=5974 RepID=A0A8J8NEP7_HALGN|nr:hypothetical protein FGO68_gene17497 [Halteria grandinella]
MPPNASASLLNQNNENTITLPGVQPISQSIQRANLQSANQDVRESKGRQSTGKRDNQSQNSAYYRPFQGLKDATNFIEEQRRGLTSSQYDSK